MTQARAMRIPTQTQPETSLNESSSIRNARKKNQSHFQQVVMRIHRVTLKNQQQAHAAPSPSPSPSPNPKQSSQNQTSSSMTMMTMEVKHEHESSVTKKPKGKFTA